MPDTDQPESHEPQPPESAERSDMLGEEPAAPIPPPRFPMRAMFLGADGLRAGWSLLLYAVLLYVLFLGSGFLTRMLWHHASVAHPKVLLTIETCLLFSVIFATWVMAKTERRPNSIYGLGGRRRARNFLAGLGWGIAMLSVLVFALRATGLLVFDARQLFGASVLRFGAVWLAGFLVVGFFEEYFFRGYLQFTLARGINGIYEWLRTFGPRETGQRTTDVSKTGQRATTRARPASGSRPCCSPSASASPIDPTRASRPSVCSPPRSSRLSSASACGAPARCGGPSASTRRGTGRSPSSTAWPTAAW